MDIVTEWTLMNDQAENFRDTDLQMWYSSIMDKVERLAAETSVRPAVFDEIAYLCEAWDHYRSEVERSERQQQRQSQN